MLVRSIISLALFLTLFASAPAGADSYSANGRQNVDEVSYPWSALGRVNNEYGGFCTGTLIGLRTVLTAAHCLRNKRRGGWLRPASLHFVAGYQRGDFLAHARVASYVIGGDAESRNGTPATPSSDWAILTLERDLGALVGTLEVSPAPAGSELMQAGYRFDRPHVLSADESCKVVGPVANGSLVAHGCAATHGDSGSPLLWRRGDDYRVGAMHVAILGGKNSFGLAIPARALGRALDLLKREQYANWPLP